MRNQKNSANEGQSPAIKYKVCKKIGEGLTSIVYRASDEKNQPLCVKVINEEFYASKIGKKLIDNEIAILKQLNHKNILTFIGKQKQFGKLEIITQLCDKGDLSQMMKLSQKTSQKKCLIIMRQLVEGCLYLHERNILHRDLKPQNIFFSGDIVKIADFGFSVKLDDKQLLSANAGSPLYMSPQALLNHEFTLKNDVFALGVIWYQMLSGKCPWSASSEKELIEKILIQKPNTEILKCSKSVRQIIQKCLESKKQLRPSMQQMKEKLCEVFKSQNIDNSSLQKCNKENKVQNLRSISSFQINPKQILKQKCTKNEKIIQCGIIMLGFDEFKKLLERLNEQKFTFLPNSSKEKFKCILVKFNELIDLSKKEKKAPLTERKKKETNSDDLISQINGCRSERQLAEVVIGFTRRLFRLAKSYKTDCRGIQDLASLCKRVQILVS